jgi:hypothetical protein
MLGVFVCKSDPRLEDLKLRRRRTISEEKASGRQAPEDLESEEVPKPPGEADGGGAAQAPLEP